MSITQAEANLIDRGLQEVLRQYDGDARQYAAFADLENYINSDRGFTDLCEVSIELYEAYTDFKSLDQAGFVAGEWAYVGLLLKSREKSGVTPEMENSYHLVLDMSTRQQPKRQPVRSGQRKVSVTVSSGGSSRPAVGRVGGQRNTMSVRSGIGSIASQHTPETAAPTRRSTARTEPVEDALVERAPVVRGPDLSKFEQIPKRLGPWDISHKKVDVVEFIPLLLGTTAVVQDGDTTKIFNVRPGEEDMEKKISDLSQLSHFVAENNFVLSDPKPLAEHDVVVDDKQTLQSIMDEEKKDIKMFDLYAPASGLTNYDYWEPVLTDQQVATYKVGKTLVNQLHRFYLTKKDNVDNLVNIFTTLQKCDSVTSLIETLEASRLPPVIRGYLEHVLHKDAIFVFTVLYEHGVYPERFIDLDEMKATIKVLHEQLGVDLETVGQMSKVMLLRAKNLMKLPENPIRQTTMWNVKEDSNIVEFTLGRHYNVLVTSHDVESAFNVLDNTAVVPSENQWYKIAPTPALKQLVDSGQNPMELTTVLLSGRGYAYRVLLTEVNGSSVMYISRF